MRSLRQNLQHWARQFKEQALTVYFAARDPRTPLLVRLLALAVAAYAFSPIDLIPDFIPIIGYLDDLVLLPLGIALIVRLTPAEVIADARQRAAQTVAQPVSRLAAGAVLLFWLAILLLGGRWLLDIIAG